MEASAQAVWLMDTLDPCVVHTPPSVALMRWDLQEHRKSKLDPEG
jgi:hypothetical protein